MLDEGMGTAAPIRAALAPVLGKPGPMIAPKQVHGTVILDSTMGNTLPNVIEGDGILLNLNDTNKTSALEVSLRFADCAPVVVFPSKENHPWVLMLHSGYKGTVLNIVKAGLEKVRACYGACAVDSALAWVGPCIGGTHYPRDKEEWTLRGLDVFNKENVSFRGEKIFFDIAGELRHQLEGAGIAKERIVLSGIDTFTCRDLCYSYRRGDSGRMFLWARLP